jgi:hypothetical protein
MALKLSTLEIKTKLPELPASLPVFALAAPALEERRGAIARLGEHFKLGALRAVELDHGVVHASERGDVTYFHASGAVSARDATVTQGASDEFRKWSGLVETTTDGQRMALNPDAAGRLIAQAKELLGPLGLLGKEAASASVQLDQVAQLDAKGNELAHGAGAATVKFDYAIGGVAVRGAGAKTLAYAEPDSAQSRFSGLFHAWRVPGQGTALKLPGLEEALGVGLLTDPELTRYGAAGHKIQITRLEFVYLALPAFLRQSHLLPAFQVEGIVSEGKLGIAFHFGRFHHAAPPRAYAAANLYGPYLSINPDGIAPPHETRKLAA